MAKTSKDLTIDYRSIMSIPPRDRRALLSSGTIDPLLGVLTPGQRVALFPDYFKQQLSGMAGQRGEFGGAASGVSLTSPRTGPSATIPSSSLPANATRRIETRPEPGAPANSSGNSSVGSSQNDPRVRRILSMISRAEGTSASYDIQFGHQNVSRQAAGGKPLTQMTINEVRELMRNTPKNKRAMGMYQFVPETFDAVVAGMGLRGDEIFDPAMQDKMIVYRLNTTRGMQDFLDGKISKEKFSQNLAYEFASLPSIHHGGNAAYGGVGLNTSRAMIPLDTVLSELEATKQMPTVAENPQDGQPSPDTNAEPSLAGVTDDTQGVGEETATAVPQQVINAGAVQPTMVLSLGSNDWADTRNTYDNARAAIEEAKRKGYKVVVIPPINGNGKIQAAHNEIMRAATDTGVQVDQPTEYGSDNLHPTTKEYKRLAEKYPNAVVAGDSIAVGIGTYAENPKVVAKVGIGTETILSRLQSDEIATIAQPEQQNTQQPAASVTPPQPTAVPAPEEPGTPPPPSSYSLVDNAAEVAGRPGYSNEQIINYIKKGYITGATLNDKGEIQFTDRAKAEQQLSGYGLDLSKLIKPVVPPADTQPTGVPTSSMAAGGVLTEPHTAINNRTGERVNLGEVGTGGEAIVPINKIRANEVGQQPYQMPTQAPAQDPRMPTQATIDKKEPAPKNPTGQQVPTNVAIAVDHQVIPPSARKAYADAGLEKRFNNFSSVGTQYRSFGI